MFLEVLIGGAASIYWVQRYVRSTTAYWRGKKRTDQFEAALRRAREELSSPIPMRIAAGPDASLVASLSTARADEDELVASGFRVLGDIVAEGSATVIMRSFVDRAGTTCAVLLVTPTHPGSVFLRLTSYSGDEVFSTGRATGPSLADPPFVHRQTLPQQPVAAVVAKHRTFAHLDDETRSFLHLDDSDALLALLAKARAETARWRDAQPPEELLDKDLRSVLGVHYGSAGRMFTRRLRGKLPTATLRR